LALRCVELDHARADQRPAAYLLGKIERGVRETTVAIV